MLGVYLQQLVYHIKGDFVLHMRGIANMCFMFDFVPVVYRLIQERSVSEVKNVFKERLSLVHVTRLRMRRGILPELLM